MLDVFNGNFQAVQDGLQRIVDFVSDARGQASQRGQLLGSDEVWLRSLELVSALLDRYFQVPSVHLRGRAKLRLSDGRRRLLVDRAEQAKVAIGIPFRTLICQKQNPDKLPVMYP